MLKPDRFPCGLLYIKTPLKTLSISITNESNENYILNYKSKLAELKYLLNIWKQKALSPKGKHPIINTLALAPLRYAENTINMSNNAIIEINNITQNFLWNGKNIQNCSV